MTKVFVGGSRRIGRLNAEVRRRIDTIVEKRLPVLIGDANGADKAVQAYLRQVGYGVVQVFCSGETPRNNLGGWPIRSVRPARARRDFDYYATKDRQMAEEASVGLMLWDGESRGTLLNVLPSRRSGKLLWSMSLPSAPLPRFGTTTTSSPCGPGWIEAPPGGCGSLQ